MPIADALARESHTGLTGTTEVRTPPPASRPEPYHRPAGKASDIAENPYFKRDPRRNYPQTSVVTQQKLSALLIAQPEGLACVVVMSRPV